MRTESEMMELIVTTAREDARIRAVFLSGSRANPNVQKDRFSDYDIGYIVTETRSFREDRSWIDRFGERLYMQYPEEGPYCQTDTERCYGWLIQLADGNRLDLHVCTLDSSWQELSGKYMYQVILDKDNCLPRPEKVTDREFWVQKPTQEQFSCTCNEFWWCMNNVAKGMWRKELLYVFDVLNDVIRPMLLRMLSWKAGIDTRFQVSVGKSCKYLGNWLPEKLMKRLLQTYPRADEKEMWAAVFLMCDLFEETAEEVSEKLDFMNNRREAHNSRAYLRSVMDLPHL